MTAATMSDELTERERAVLAFEGQRWLFVGSKANAVLDLFGWSLHRHEQQVTVLIDRPAALREFPQTVRRLQRVRAARRAARLAPAAARGMGGV